MRRNSLIFDLFVLLLFLLYSGAKRNYSTNRYEDGSGGPPKREFNRSLSSENWRDRGGNEEEEEEGDWRRAGGSKWSKWGKMLGENWKFR